VDDYKFEYLFAVQLLIVLQKECTIQLIRIITMAMSLTALPLPDSSKTIEWHNGGAVDTPRTAFVVPKCTVRLLHKKTQ